MTELSFLGRAVPLRQKLIDKGGGEESEILSCRHCVLSNTDIRGNALQHSAMGQEVRCEKKLKEIDK